MAANTNINKVRTIVVILIFIVKHVIFTDISSIHNFSTTSNYDTNECVQKSPISSAQTCQQELMCTTGFIM